MLGQVLVARHHFEELVHAYSLIRESLLDLVQLGVEHCQVDHEIALVGGLLTLLDKCVDATVLGLAPLEVVVDLLCLVLLGLGLHVVGVSVFWKF